MKLNEKWGVVVSFERRAATQGVGEAVRFRYAQDSYKEPANLNVL